MERCNKSAILVMMKAPHAGEVKTRLTPPLTSEECASLAVCFAHDTVAKALSLVSDVHITYTPETALFMLKEMFGPNLVCIPQFGNDLGIRMHTAIQTCFNSLLCPIILCGTDCPTFPANLITEAIVSLTTSKTDVVIAPTEDGGFHLIGVREPLPYIYDDVVWSTDTVLEKVLHNTSRLGLRTLLLPEWYDIDTIDDFHRLQIEMNSSQIARECAPRTAAWLKQYEDNNHHSNPE